MSFCPFVDTKRASCATFRHHSDPHLVQINMVLPKNSSQQCVTKEANVSDKKKSDPPVASIDHVLDAWIGTDSGSRAHH